MKRIAAIVGLIFALAINVTAALSFPRVLGGNTFLEAAVNHELLALLLVAMTITFASVANIHIAVGGMQAKIVDKNARERINRDFAQPLRDDTRSSCWLLFYTLAIMTAACVVKGQLHEYDWARSFVNGLGIIALIVNGLVLHDIYGTIFELVEAGADAASGGYGEDAPSVK